MASTNESASRARRRAVRDILLYGLSSGVLIVVLKLTEYRFLVVEHSVEIYGALIAALFAGLGIWLGLTITRKKSPADVPGRSIPETIEAATIETKTIEAKNIETEKIETVPAVPARPVGPFVADEARVGQFGITARELEILGLIATGLSNREIAGRLFVSENTVKTHSSRLFDKLGARRRTQAVQIGQQSGLLP